MSRQRNEELALIRERIQLWVDALESGDYPQYTEGSLYGPEPQGYCCLGVADKVCNLGTLFAAGNLVKTYHLLGLRSPDGLVSRKLQSLTRMNDSGRWPFTRIAQYIRRYPQCVFVYDVARYLKANPLT